MAGLKSQPEYEAMPETETKTKDDTMNTKTTTTQDNVASAGVAATVAIATANATAVAVSRPAAKFSIAFADKNGVFDTTTVEGLALATPRIKGEQGSLFQDQLDHGAELQFELISFNHRWVVGTGEDDKEAKDFFRVSYDNKTISGTGECLQTYLESLKAQGFNKSRISPYLDVFGFITWSEKKGHIAPDERELVCLQCSQTSLGAFTAFSTTRGLLESKGVSQPLEIIEVHAEKRISGTNKYTNFSFHTPKVK